jgi:hypothetical protein
VISHETRQVIEDLVTFAPSEQGNLFLVWQGPGIDYRLPDTLSCICLNNPQLRGTDALLAAINALVLQYAAVAGATNRSAVEGIFKLLETWEHVQRDAMPAER